MNTGLLILTIVEALLIVAVVVLFLRHTARNEEAWADERRELITRVLRPGLIPVKPKSTPAPTPPRRGAGHQVGMVHDGLQADED